ncbi:FkbM family methyltransferase [Bradyrhizobium sp. SYSU BS000235]|uniref:FkbM family methyltransferase n=1 Tax=Bradyrhizobium sp. SYSU BS000235 TaxID=3411332 RepID=UPI003C76C39B
MKLKAFARYIYASVPGAAAARFAAKDFTAAYVNKPEFGGVPWLDVGKGLIIDVGANRGQSIAAFRKAAPGAHIIAFEPEPRSAKRLAAHYHGDRTVEIDPCALGANAGMIAFFVPTYGHWDCDGMSALSHETATEWLRDPGRMYLFDETKLTVEEHPVICKTLDSLELCPRLMKLHAQGAERSILEGAQQTLLRHKPALMCAFPPDSLSHFLSGFGYRPYIYRQGHFIPGVAKRPVTFTWYLIDEDAQRVPLAVS